MTDEDRFELEKLTDEFLAEVEANPAPGRKQWQAMLERWQGRVNVEVLLTYGAARGWLGDAN